jgi:hypothetical protein
LSAEAAKDARPADSSSSHRALASSSSWFGFGSSEDDDSLEDGKRFLTEFGRSKEHHDYYQAIYGNTKRLLHAEPTPDNEQPEGAMTTSAGVVIGTSSTVDKLIGFAAIERLWGLAPESVGLIKSVILPGPSGEIKLGPFTKIIMASDIHAGNTKTFLFGEQDYMMMVEPAMIQGCTPKKYIQIGYVSNAQYIDIDEVAIATNGLSFFEEQVPTKECGESDEDFQMRLEHYHEHRRLTTGSNGNAAGTAKKNLYSTYCINYER